MITLMIVFMFDICCWLFRLMFVIAIIPFKILWWALFGWFTPSSTSRSRASRSSANRRRARDYDDGFEDGFIYGSFWD